MIAVLIGAAVAVVSAVLAAAWRVDDARRAKLAWRWSNAGPGVGPALGILGLWALSQLGQGLGALTVQALDDKGGKRPRAAHLASPSLLDFVTPVEVWWTRASALAALAVAAFALFAVGRTALDAGLAATVAYVLLGAFAASAVPLGWAESTRRGKRRFRRRLWAASLPSAGNEPVTLTTDPTNRGA